MANSQRVLDGSIPSNAVKSRAATRLVAFMSALSMGGLLFAAGQPTALESSNELRLEVAWRSAPAVLIDPNLPPPITVRITNTSRTRDYPVVQAGGGSQRGPVEPLMRWSVERHAPGKGWSPWDSGARGVRADALGTDWRLLIVALQPGQTLDLKTTGLFFNVPLSNSPPGTYRARAIYSFGASDEAPPESLVGVRSFDLVSNPVVFTYSPPYTIELDEVSSWSPGQSADLGSLVSARLVNQSQSVLAVPRMSASQRTVIVHAYPNPRKHDLRIEWPKPVEGEAAIAMTKTFIELKPGESVPLFGPDGLCDDADFRLMWVGKDEHSVRTPPIGVVVRLRVAPGLAPLSVSSMPIEIPLAR